MMRIKRGLNGCAARGVQAIGIHQTTQEHAREQVEAQTRILKLRRRAFKEFPNHWEVESGTLEQRESLGALGIHFFEKLTAIGHAGVVTGDSGSDVFRAEPGKRHRRAVNGVGTFTRSRANHVLKTVGVFTVIVQQPAPFGQIMEMRGLRCGVCSQLPGQHGNSF